MLKAALVTLKQHRFEVGVAFLAAVVAGVLGLTIAFRLDELGASRACLDSSVASQDGSDIEPDCFALVREGSQILGETYLAGQGTVPLSVMGALPFLLGVLGGVPIVARELEARTAQTAWSLSGSRNRWLVRQVAPIALVLGVGMTFAALVAIPVAEYWVAWGHGGASDAIGLHGLLAVVRAFAALGVGLMVGAMLGRTLSAFLFGVAISLAVLFAVGSARDAWRANLEPSVIAQYTETGEYQLLPRAVTTGWGVETPDGTLLSSADARQIATAAGVPAAPPDDVQDIPALTWYEANGYVLLPLGVSDEMALAWAPYDGAIFGVVGVLSLAATVVLVNRRRPA